MRTFLPIKGPGGRYLTPREKIALLVLGVALALCVLTLLAGDRAYQTGQDFNPISAFAAWLARTFGGGIIALYGLVIVWSGLIYFRGENAVRVGPLPGRFFAALCVTIGVSGLLGIPGLVTAGALGAKVGGAIGNTFGAPLGFPVLILLLMLGAHLAGQGALSAIREPALAGATGSSGGGGFGGALGFGQAPSSERLPAQSPLPDDGDPSSDERTLAVTRAMEEIERSKGVTIVDVAAEPESEPADPAPEPPGRAERSTIGEEVEAAPEPAEDTDEADVRRGLLHVETTLAGPDAADDECIDVGEYRDRGEDEAPAYEDESDEADEARDGDASADDEAIAEPDSLLAGLTATVVEDDVRDEEDAEDERAEADEDRVDDEESGSAAALADALSAADAALDAAENETQIGPEVDEDEDLEDDGEAAVNDEDAVQVEDPVELEDDEVETDADDEADEADEADEDVYDEETYAQDDETDEFAPPVDETDEEEPEELAGSDQPEEDVRESETGRRTRGLDDEAGGNTEDEEDDDGSVERQLHDESDPSDEEEDAGPESEGREGDPFAKGGLLRRTGMEPAGDEDDAPFTAFDWRGRPLD